jgi:hypothetical protein
MLTTIIAKQWQNAEDAKEKRLRLEGPSSMNDGQLVFALEVLDKYCVQVFVEGEPKSDIVVLAHGEKTCQPWETALYMLTSVQYLGVDDPVIRRSLLTSIRQGLTDGALGSVQLEYVHKHLSDCGPAEIDCIPLVMLRCLKLLATCGDELPAWQPEFLMTVVRAGLNLSIVPVIRDLAHTLEIIGDDTDYDYWRICMQRNVPNTDEAHELMRLHVQAMWSAVPYEPRPVHIFAAYALVPRRINDSEFDASYDFYGLTLRIGLSIFPHQPSETPRVVARCDLDYGEAKAYRTKTHMMLSVDLRYLRPDDETAGMESGLITFHLDYFKGVRLGSPLADQRRMVHKNYQSEVAYLRRCAETNEPWAWLSVFYNVKV